MRKVFFILFTGIPAVLFGQCNILPTDAHLDKFREDFPGTQRINEWYSVEIDSVCLLQVNQLVKGMKQQYFYLPNGDRFGLVSEQPLSSLPSTEYWLSGFENQRLRLYSVMNGDLPYSVYVLATEQKLIFVSPEGFQVNPTEMPQQIVTLCGILPWK